ncbi:hypothetical protein Bca101_026238 [Brassica carinata]
MRRAPLMKNILVDLELKVSDLIDFQNGSWCLDKLQELFFEEDINRILAMKTVFEQDDYWVWLHNKHGFYSVKSGYWFINSFARREEIREAEARPSLNDLKSEVWKIQTAPKIKTFVWRAVSNAIPVGELLVKRGIKMDPVCQACGFQGESINHIIFQCSVARQVWALANVPHLEYRFDEWSKLRKKRSFGYWREKNDQRLEKEEIEALTVVKKSWSVPPRGWMKGNIGVDWSKNQAKCGAAWVVRDETGKVILHSRRAFFNVCSLEETKYQTLIWSLESFHSHHLNRIIIALEDTTLPKVISRPRAWPNFKCQHAELIKRLAKIEW